MCKKENIACDWTCRTDTHARTVAALEFTAHLWRQSLSFQHIYTATCILIYSRVYYIYKHESQMNHPFSLTDWHMSFYAFHFDIDDSLSPTGAFVRTWFIFFLSLAFFFCFHPVFCSIFFLFCVLLPLINVKQTWKWSKSQSNIRILKALRIIWLMKIKISNRLDERRKPNVKYIQFIFSFRKFCIFQFVWERWKVN